MTQEMTADRTKELKRREAAFRQATAKADRLRSERNQAISGALADGCTLAQVAAVTGLSRARIGQLDTLRREAS